MKHPDVFTVVVNTQNAAFDGEIWRNEVSFILKGIAQRLLDEGDYAETPERLADTNGNFVGQAWTT